MDFLWKKITEWLKEMLVSGVISNLTGLFDATNQKVGEIAGQVSMTPQAWNASIFGMIQNLSNSVIVPIAGATMIFVRCLMPCWMWWSSAGRIPGLMTCLTVWKK